MSRMVRSVVYSAAISSWDQLALLPFSRQPEALQGQNEAAAAPARLTDPLCPGSRDRREPSPCGNIASLAPKPTWEVPEASPFPLCRAQHGQVSWLGSLVLYRPAQVSEDRIKPQAGGGGEESFVVVLWLESKAAAGPSRWHKGRGIWRTCLGWLAPVSHHLTHSRRQSLAQQHRDIRPTGDQHRQRLLPGITPGHTGPWRRCVGRRGIKGSFLKSPSCCMSQNSLYLCFGLAVPRVPPPHTVSLWLV